MALGDAMRGASRPHLCPGPGAVTGDGDLGLQQLWSPDVPRVPMVLSQLHLGPLGSIRIRKSPPPDPGEADSRWGACGELVADGAGHCIIAPSDGRCLLGQKLTHFRTLNGAGLS